MSYRTITYAVEDGIATLTMAQPAKLNAFSTAMMAEMIDAFDRIDADDAVRAVIVTGEGRAFCAGADISAGPDGFIADADADLLNADGTIDYAKAAARDGGGLLTLRIFRCLKPVIAAINGAAVGIGATMTLPMDIRIASHDARFGFVFVRRGIVPEAASAWFLPRIVGISQALEWCYSGRLFPASEAAEGGLVKAVCEPEELLATARTLARGFVESTAPVSIALTRQMLWQGMGMRHPMDAHRIDSRAIMSRGRSADAAEGVTAFLEKRPAAFPDRVSADMPDFFPWWDEPTYH
jgi:enoyl-CoA hydratase/carnithine racemase